MAHIKTHILGFPRIGAQRELKFALEKFWRGDIDADALEEVGQNLRARHWALQAEAGLDFVTVGDFSFYDQVADHIQLFGCEPERFGFNAGSTQLERYFAMARGAGPQHSGCACHPQGNLHALEMTKWFDTNYHYLVPEFSADTQFDLAPQRLLARWRQAQALGHAGKVALIGPLTFLWLGKEKSPGFERIGLLDGLLLQYCRLLERLKAAGVQWVQLDEPILGMDLEPAWRNAFERSYWQLNQAGVKILLATYFSTLDEHLSLACRLPVAGLHVDAVRAPEELASVADWLPGHKLLSIGIVDGRNIWRTDLDAALARLEPLLEKRPGEIWLAPSCSLLHVPISLEAETALDSELKSWLAFAREKLAELHTLKSALAGDETAQEQLQNTRAILAARRSSERVSRLDVGRRLGSIDAAADKRSSPFSSRKQVQAERFGLPLFPTTTIGSFPQTAEVRAARAAWRQGQIGGEEYEQRMREEIADAVRRQENLGLDVLVHGEAERSDMVEYFGEQLDGFAFTRNGWVQSYGSRCVKPPIIFGDVARPRPMTVEWTRFAQSLTEKPVKGMLTGPITILQWSFVRDDQPRASTALQIALAVRDEVSDLQHAGIGIIQIDEPALREGLPLRRKEWDAYLTWATRAFRIAAGSASDDTQIHTHMCYAEFNDILPHIAALDADVITIEASRSDMELLQGFGRFRYPNQIGPGVYDIHSPRIPSVAEMTDMLEKARAVFPLQQLWVNPDCGLKTRTWAESEGALANMVAAAKLARASCLKAQAA